MAAERDIRVRDPVKGGLETTSTYCERQEIHTSMSKSGSRRTAEPNKVMYCIKLANCHMSRSCRRNVGFATCSPSSTTSSSRARFLAGIVVAVCVVGGVKCGLQCWLIPKNTEGVLQEEVSCSTRVKSHKIGGRKSQDPKEYVFMYSLQS